MQHVADWVAPFRRSQHSPSPPLKLFRTPPPPPFSYSPYTCTRVRGNFNTNNSDIYRYICIYITVIINIIASNSYICIEYMFILIVCFPLSYSFFYVKEFSHFFFATVLFIHREYIINIYIYIT